MMADSAPSTIQPPPESFEDDSPPKRTRKESGPRAARTTTVKKIEENISAQITGVGMMIGQADAVSGFIIITGAPQFASSWAEVARVNPQVRIVLEKWFTGSVYMNAGMATAMIALPLLTHYGLLPRAWFNPSAAQTTIIEEMSKSQSLEEMLIAHERMKDMMSKMSASDMATMAGMASNGAG